MVMQLPEGDRYSMDYQQMTSRLAIMMAGRVSEELIFGKDKVTSARPATSRRPRPGATWSPAGASPTPGHGVLRRQPGRGLPWPLGARTQNVSEDTAKDRFRSPPSGPDRPGRGRRILTERLEDLHTLAKALLEFETLSGDEITNVLKGIPPRRDEPEDKRPSGPRSRAPDHAPDPSSGLMLAGDARPASALS